MLCLLRHEDLSVAELQDILGMGQSRISSHLSKLREAELVTDRRSGKNIIYTFGNENSPVDERMIQTLELAASDIEEIKDDRDALAMAVQKRTDKARAYFDELAGKFGKTYCPGRSWKALAETLLKLMPPMIIADLGAGEGTFSQLLAQRAEKVIAVDNSEKMVEFGTKVARENGYQNLEYRFGSLDDTPIDSNTVDIAFFSQALHHAEKPEKAISEAHRILKLGGKIVIMDLLKHQFEEARDLYADTWLGFSELEISRLLTNESFCDIEISVVDREADPPHFQTIMALGTKSS
jgi:ArsR family transcriptional regulator